MKKWELSRSFNFNGNYIRWDKKGTGEPLILVHGTPWSSFNLRHLIDGLSHKYEVFYFDLLGYGQSDKPNADVSLGIQNNILDRLIDYWEIENPVAIGHDIGGATVLRTHLLNNRMFKKLVLIDPVAISPWGSSFFKHVQNHEDAFAGVPDYIHKAIVNAYVQTAAFQPIPPDTLEQIIAPWTGDTGKAAFYRQISQAESRYTDEIQDRYGEIEMPTLILWGKEDEWIPVEKGKLLHQLIPNSELKVIPESGHLVIEEKPKELLEEIEMFII